MKKKAKYLRNYLIIQKEKKSPNTSYSIAGRLLSTTKATSLIYEKN
ncbi:MAG: hypothetical protein AABY22_30940 [Nanoarchaeota archaeon]